MRSRITTSLIGFMLTLTAVAQADQLFMRNGDRLTGTVIRMSDDKLTFETSYGGKLNIRWSEVATLLTDRPVAVMLQDDTHLETQHISSEDSEQATAATQVAHINPPPEISGNGFAFTGHIDVGLNQTSGNTDTLAYRLNIETVARRKAHRITLGATYNQASDAGVESISNARLNAQYDHFFNKRWYGYTNLQLQQDKFKDLKLRRELGAGIGHQFYDQPDLKLTLETGLSKVSEEFYVAASESNSAWRWAADFEQRVYHSRLTLFHEHALSVPLAETDNFVASAKTGLRVPIANHLTTAIEVDVDYDNQPSLGSKDTDLLYLFTLGYSW